MTFEAKHYSKVDHRIEQVNYTTLMKVGYEAIEVCCSKCGKLLSYWCYFEEFEFPCDCEVLNEM